MVARRPRLDRGGEDRSARTDRAHKGADSPPCATQGSPSSGNRSPIGESPGNRYKRSGRTNHLPLVHGGRSASTPVAVERVADDLGKSLLEHARETSALELVFELGVERIDIDRQPTLFPEVVPGVFVGGMGQPASTPSVSASAARSALHPGRYLSPFSRFQEQRARARPARRPCGSSKRVPSEAKRLTGVPLALSPSCTSAPGVNCG